MLFDMAKEVWEELNGVFRFKYTDTEGQIYSLKYPDAQRLYLDLQKLRGLSDEHAKEELRKRLVGQRNEECHYVSDIFKNSPDHPVDYMIFVTDVHDATPIALGEEITHGEHTTQHLRDSGSYAEFARRFSQPTKEFLGLLGSCRIAKSHNAVINVYEPEVTGGDVDQYDLDHWIGYGVVAQLVNLGKEIPYAELFHAPDQKIVWSMVRELVQPHVALPHRERGVNDALYKRALETVKGCSLFGENFSFQD
jgi:hypothetical protein